ncbi:MAG: peptidoglycan DD-metalloendopeptidase family protein [Burkholderiaceae bacterium]|nr:peptidoglycan DD-metalloendopeptidase family protein [Burkholderiaceae bacterium]
MQSTDAPPVGAVARLGRSEAVVAPGQDRLAVVLAPLMIAGAALVAGCSTPISPAPIINRPAVPATPASVTVPRAEIPAAAGAGGGAAETGPAPIEASPIRAGRIESRTLGGTVALPGASAESANAGVRMGPSGLKQPYSEQALKQAGQASSANPPAMPAPSVAAVKRPIPLPAPAPKADRDPAAGMFIWPAKGKLGEGFDAGKQMGISIAGRPGDPVVAAAAGKVIFSGLGPRGYGQLLIVQHPKQSLLSVYAHNRKLLVKEGQFVKQGQKIAEIGATGTNSPKLHFEIRRQGKPIDPLRVLPER